MRDPTEAQLLFPKVVNKRMGTEMGHLQARSTAPKLSLQKLCSLLLVAGCMGGCGSPVGFSLGTNNAASLTGNWQFTATDATGAAAFTSFAGFIDQTTAADLTAVFQVQPGTCYLGATTVPASGTVNGTTVSMSSFAINGQYVYITSSATATHNALTGTYQISGGCANGATGTISGTRYAPVTGTYTGSLGSPEKTASLTLTQGPLGNGSGYSPVTGSATVKGVSCFTTATLNDNSGYVIGSSAQLTFTAADGESLAVLGTIDTQAKFITIASATISGGACAGSLGSGSVTQS